MHYLWSRQFNSTPKIRRFSNLSCNKQAAMEIGNEIGNSTFIVWVLIRGYQTVSACSSSISTNWFYSSSRRMFVGVVICHIKSAEGCSALQLSSNRDVGCQSRRCIVSQPLPKRNGSHDNYGKGVLQWWCISLEVLIRMSTNSLIFPIFIFFNLVDAVFAKMGLGYKVLSIRLSYPKK